MVPLYNLLRWRWYINSRQCSNPSLTKNFSPLKHINGWCRLYEWRTPTLDQSASSIAQGTWRVSASSPPTHKPSCNRIRVCLLSSEGRVGIQSNGTLPPRATRLVFCPVALHDASSGGEAQSLRTWNMAHSDKPYRFSSLKPLHTVDKLLLTLQFENISTSLEVTEMVGVSPPRQNGQHWRIGEHLASMLLAVLRVKGAKTRGKNHHIVTRSLGGGGCRGCRRRDSHTLRSPYV
jgi:hypothetical protein